MPDLGLGILMPYKNVVPWTEAANAEKARPPALSVPIGGIKSLVASVKLLHLHLHTECPEIHSPHQKVSPWRGFHLRN